MDENNKNELKTKVDDNKLLGELKQMFDLGLQYYRAPQQKMKMLDAVDSGDLWKALGAKFPKYQILPDTNFVTYVKCNLVASLYTVAKSAEVVPTSESDAELIAKINICLDHLWDVLTIPFYEYQAGERCALMNLGITQVGWDEEITGGTNDGFIKGNINLKNIDPISFMRDPFATDLQSSAWCCTYTRLHDTVFLKNKLYKERYEVFKEQHKDGGSEQLPDYAETDRPTSAADGYHNLVIYWVRQEDGSINCYHTVDTTFVLKTITDIKPRMFPFAMLYCNLPGNKLVGCSEPMKIFANNAAYNIMESIALTAEYKNQRPPKFINSQSGLNVNAFTKHGDEADRTFIVNGDASKAVHYHEFPQVSNSLASFMDTLNYNIYNITGVDGKYTGRDTGSIITTGGTEEMLNRVTIIDTPKILNYEAYTRELTKLVLSNLIQHCPKRKYFIKQADPNNQHKQKYKTVEIDFPAIDNKTVFNYAVMISSELPKNKQRVAALANMMMEKQMQYRHDGTNVELITEEEWLRFQDLPNKEFMLERMGFQRDTDALQETGQVLFQYAQLIEQGMDPNEAMLLTAQNLASARQGIPPDSMPSDAMPAPMATPGVNDMAQGMLPTM